MNDIGKINQRDRTQMEIPWQMFSLPCCGMPTRIESLLHCQSRSCGVRVIWNERFPGWADWVEWNSSHKQHLRKLTCAATWFLAQESCLLVWLWAIQYAISANLQANLQESLIEETWGAPKGTTIPSYYFDLFWPLDVYGQYQELEPALKQCHPAIPRKLENGLSIDA